MIVGTAHISDQVSDQIYLCQFFISRSLTRSDRMRTVECSHHLLYRTQFYSNETSRSEPLKGLYYKE